jgi:hypothetical protein
MSASADLSAGAYRKRYSKKPTESTSVESSSLEGFVERLSRPVGGDASGDAAVQADLQIARLAVVAPVKGQHSNEHLLSGGPAHLEIGMSFWYGQSQTFSTRRNSICVLTIDRVDGLVESHGQIFQYENELPEPSPHWRPRLGWDARRLEELVKLGEDVPLEDLEGSANDLAQLCGDHVRQIVRVGVLAGAADKFIHPPNAVHAPHVVNLLEEASLQVATSAPTLGTGGRTSRRGEPERTWGRMELALV